jgi:hypothetical protein
MGHAQIISLYGKHALALTQVFVKWKKIDHHVLRPTAAQQEEWESEYRNVSRRDKSKRSGFEKSADLVSKCLTGKLFDDFVSGFVSGRTA